MEEDKITKGKYDDGFDDILKISSMLKVPASNHGKEVAWEQLINSIQKDRVKDAPIIPFYASRKLWYSFAASIAVLVAIASLTYRYATIEFQTSKGKTYNMILPDSSEVRLNSETKIEYRRFGWLSNREITLNGEAFFSVKHGSRFVVLSELNRKVIVTGTKFNVLSRGIQFEVKCFDGSVTVQTSESKSVSLTKGRGVAMNTLEESPKNIPFESIAEPTWIRGEYYFSNIPLNLVLDELSRQFNVTVKSDGFNPSARNYTGFFKRNSLSQALDLVCIPMVLTYQISSDSTSVIIRK